MKKLFQLLRENPSVTKAPLNVVRAENGEQSIYIYDVIDSYWGISAKDVAQAISAMDANATLHLRINSPGGDVFEAHAIATAISQHAGKTIAHIDGLAASAATFISAAADEVEISEGGFYMIHNGWTIAIGDKRAMTATAELLDKVDASIVNVYAKRTGAELEQIVEWMNAETWFTAEEAVQHNFANRLASKPEKASNATAKAFNLSAFDKAPKALLQPPEPPADPNPVDAAQWRTHNERRLRLLNLNA